jgi:PPP family 3-phenylpropionic acid transporter
LHYRLSSYYFFYFASIGAFVPYFSLYLKSLGFDSIAISEIIAVTAITRIIAPNIWAWIADHTGKHMSIIRVTSLLSIIFFAGIFISNSYWWLISVMVIYSFFWNAGLPLFEAVTLSHLGNDTHKYTDIRLWGSIGFIVLVLGLGFLFEYQKIGLLPIVLIIVITGIWIASLIVPNKIIPHDIENHTPLIVILKKPIVIAILIVSFLMQVSHGQYYIFYSIYLKDYGYNSILIGQLWALGVISEIVIFMYMSKLVRKFGLRFLLLTSFILTAIRWLTIGYFVENLFIVILAQLLHAASFGIYHAVAIQYIHKYFNGNNRGRGQAIYSSVSFGLGGLVGTLGSGYLWENLGALNTYILAAGICILAYFIIFISNKD